MLAAFVMCLMLASGQGAQVLLEKLNDQYIHCTWGAQFWCSSFSTAEACGKTDWCTKHHWPYDEVQDVPCTVMQQLVTNIRTLARASSHSFLTQDEIAVFIVKSCAVLQDGQSRNQCKQLITDEDILVKLLSLVGSDLSVQSVATAVGVCKRNIPSEKQQSVVACDGLKPCGSSPQNVINGDSEEQIEVAGPVCFICQFVMQKLDSLLGKNATEKQIEAVLQKVCSFFPSFIRQKCSAFVSKYIPRLVQLLLRYPPQMVCSVIGLCTDHVGASVNEIQHSPNVKDPGCFLCKLIINQVKSMLSDHTTQDEIKAALEKVCHQLPPFFESVCDTFVETYEPQLIQMLLSSFTPEQICEKLNLCTSVQDKIQQSSNVKDPGCFLCKLIINQVKSMLSDHTTQDEIKAALEKVCHQLPPFFESVCDTFVETYEPQLIQMLLSSFTPEQICEKLNLCTDKIQQSSNVKDPGCFLCKLIINQVKSMLSDHTTQDEIKAALEKVCHQLPPFFESVCDTFVERYEPQLIQMLLSSFTPEQICEKLNLCTGVQVSVDMIQQSSNVKDPGCFLCKLIINQVKSMLSDHTTQDEIKAALEKVCHQLPPFFESVCDTFVETYEPQLIQMLLSSFTPEQICEKLNLCTGVQVSVDMIQQSSNVKDPGCFLCKLIINQVKSMLSDHTTQDEIKAALKKLCHQLPPFFESVCDTFVETYEPQLIQMLLSSFTPEQICEKLNLCTGVQVTANEIQQPSSVNSTKPKCSLCKLIINHVKYMLSDHTTQDEIKTALKKVCHLLPPILTSLCKHFIEISEQQLIQMLLSSYTTEQICDKLKMCTAVQDKSQLLMFVPEKDAQSTTLSDKEHCSTCLIALYNFQSTLNNPNWQSGSMAALHQLCGYIKTDQELCKLLVDASFSGIVRYMQNSQLPGEFCQKAGFCDPADCWIASKISPRHFLQRFEIHWQLKQLVISLFICQTYNNKYC